MTIERTPRTALIRSLCERASTHQRMVEAVTNAVRLTLPAIVEELIWEAVPQGEQLRLYKSTMDTRRERAKRIVTAIDAGERVADIAKRERMSHDGVRRAYKRMCTTSPP